MIYHEESKDGVKTHGLLSASYPGVEELIQNLLVKYLSTYATSDEPPAVLRLDLSTNRCYRSFVHFYRLPPKDVYGIATIARNTNPDPHADFALGPEPLVDILRSIAIIIEHYPDRVIWLTFDLSMHDIAVLKAEHGKHTISQ